MRRIILATLLSLGALLLFQGGADNSADAATAAGAKDTAVLLTIDGVIGPATADYFLHGLEKAQERGAGVVILQMNTPGGLDSAMREIIQAIIGSPIPVISYVAPSGARAASAGTYILYASHVAAMAPATNLGAATPVQVGGGMPGMPSPKKPPGQEQPQDENEGQEVMGNESAMRHKVVNDAVAYIKGLAELRGRNAQWAEAAVREAVSLTATEALEKNVIDSVASGVGDLLQQAHGKPVKVGNSTVTLQTQNMVIEAVEPDWRNELLAILTNPNVAYILMLIGIYGLIFEFSSPGAIVPGVVGAICLLLALFAFQAIPINYAGLGLMVLGVLLMVAEAFVPSFGALGIGGVIAFVIGSVMLVDTDSPVYGVSPVLIVSVASISSVLFLVVVIAAVRAQRRRAETGEEAMVGARGMVLDDFDKYGQVRVMGEIWKARSPQPLQKDQEIQVDAMDGLTLIVSPHNSTEKE
jgi:membrane-bound serine protease (ClpP class)